MGQTDHARWLDDYAADIAGAGFDSTDVQIACRNWRTSEAKKMATPGELLAYCRKVFRPDQRRNGVVPISSTAPRPQYSEAHKAEMRAKIGGLLNVITRRNYNRLGGETESEYAERLWPDRRIDRMRASGRA